MSLKNKTVAYFYDQEIGNFSYGVSNPMRPHRVRLTHSLVDSYGLGSKMLVNRPQPSSADELERFHADEYVNFLSCVTPDNQDEYMAQMRRFNLGILGEADCPVFDGLFEYCQIYTGGSVNSAALMNEKKADICLNWSGGLHHAKKAEASGFCFVNDIVLAILELLKVHQRVLYVDIDIHHGDGVEEAFYTTDRVMTVSFHKYGDFFPGTGSVEDVGIGDGKHYSVNVPLQEGMDDESYRFMFEPIMQKVMEVFQPEAIVVCGGADSLSGDRLGCFNLSLEGHAGCMEFLAKFGVPMLILGGGGYTLRNVARCWCFETSRCLGLDLDDHLPDSALKEFDLYDDTHRLRITVSNMKNGNSRKKLEEIKTAVLKGLNNIAAAPGAQFAPVPPRHQIKDDPEEDMDVRGGGLAAKDRRIVKDEDYASDNDADFMEEDRPQQQQQQHQHQQAQHAQQAAGFENHVRGGTPGSGSAASSYATPAQSPFPSRSSTPAPADLMHPKLEPKQERGATPPVHMGAIKTEPKQERGTTPPVGFPAAAQAASHSVMGTHGHHGGALPQGAQGLQSSALPQAAGGPAGPGPSARASPYYSRRSPSPLPMRQHPGPSHASAPLQQPTGAYPTAHPSLLASSGMTQSAQQVSMHPHDPTKVKHEAQGRGSAGAPPPPPAYPPPMI
ncbi:hypothetical protein ABBQ38_012298 [Trebouxia sp. C0009 RCD-2024]